MREHVINSLNNFICGFYIDDPSICDGIVDFFNELRDFEKGPGQLGGRVDTSQKDSTDTIFPDFGLDHRTDKFFTENVLKGSVDAYVEKYPVLKDQYKFGFYRPLNIQHYKPGGGFHQWHCERDEHENTINRILVWMIYLNDVTEGGETAFMHQNIKIKPEKGLVLIWPSDWTHTHKGISSQTQDKYIATGWLEYLVPELN
jgi:hypothetical protein